MAGSWSPRGGIVPEDDKLYNAYPGVDYIISLNKKYWDDNAGEWKAQDCAMEYTFGYPSGISSITEVGPSGDQDQAFRVPMVTQNVDQHVAVGLIKSDSKRIVCTYFSQIFLGDGMPIGGSAYGHFYCVMDDGRVLFLLFSKNGGSLDVTAVDYGTGGLQHGGIEDGTVSNLPFWAKSFELDEVISKKNGASDLYLLCQPLSYRYTDFVLRDNNLFLFYGLNSDRGCYDIALYDVERDEDNMWVFDRSFGLEANIRNTDEDYPFDEDMLGWYEGLNSGFHPRAVTSNSYSALRETCDPLTLKVTDLDGPRFTYIQWANPQNYIPDDNWENVSSRGFYVKTVFNYVDWVTESRTILSEVSLLEFTQNGYQYGANIGQMSFANDSHSDVESDRWEIGACGMCCVGPVSPTWWTTRYLYANSSGFSRFASSIMRIDFDFLSSGKNPYYYNTFGYLYNGFKLEIEPMSPCYAGGALGSSMNELCGTFGNPRLGTAEYLRYKRRETTGKKYSHVSQRGGVLFSQRTYITKFTEWYEDHEGPEAIITSASESVDYTCYKGGGDLDCGEDFYDTTFTASYDYTPSKVVGDVDAVFDQGLVEGGVPESTYTETHDMSYNGWIYGPNISYEAAGNPYGGVAIVGLQYLDNRATNEDEMLLAFKEWGAWKVYYGYSSPVDVKQKVVNAISATVSGEYVDVESSISSFGMV